MTLKNSLLDYRSKQKYAIEISGQKGNLSVFHVSFHNSLKSSLSCILPSIRPKIVGTKFYAE